MLTIADLLKPGSLNYGQAFGSRSLKDQSSNSHFTWNTVIRIASSTKLVTGIAALQCVKSGLIDLGQDVVGMLPELKDLRFQVDFDADGKPISEEATEPITLRFVEPLPPKLY